VRNHVKLTICNHRLKASPAAVETADPQSETTCVVASGREEIRVCNTRLKESTSNNLPARSVHAEATTYRDDDETTALMVDEDIEVDWRRQTDGHSMAKHLRYIEQQESDYQRTGERPTHGQDSWRKQLEVAMREKPPEPRRRPVFQASKYDSSTVQLLYEDFTTRASWNFSRDRAPVFRNRESRAFAMQSTQQSPFVIEPEPVSPAKLDGRAYTRASPTFFKARINEIQYRPTVGLLDNCAAISLIDRRLVKALDPAPMLYDGEVKIKGIGTSSSSQFCVLPIFIDVNEKDESGNRHKRRVRILVEFHVIDDLNESFVLGMDIIGPYQIDILTSRAEAKIQTAGGASFPLLFGPGMTKASIQQSYNVVAAETITIPGQSETTIPALIAGHGSNQTARYDLFLDPIPIWDDAMDMLGMVGKGLYSSDTSKVWFANLGSHPITIRKGTRIASATHVSSMDTISVLPIKHTAGGPGRAEIFSCVPKKATDPLTMRKMKSKLQEPHWSVHVQQYAFPAILMEPTDRPPPEDPQEEGTFDVSTDFGEYGRNILLRTLRTNEAAFTMDGRPGLVNSLELELDTDDRMLHPEKLRQTSPRKQVIIDETLDQLLEWDIISPSDSRVSYPVVIVHQNGKDRFCVDYRNLNKHTRPMVYPMQRSDEMFEALAGKQIFSSLDAARGYHQIPIATEHRWKTAFITHRGLFEYNTMPFGLKTAPGIFQRFMDGILGRLRWTAALCYIDDVIIFSDTVEEHADHIGYVLQAAAAAGLKFSPSKCHFGYASLKLLGRRVSTEGLEVLQDKLAAVQELRAPRNLKELWHVLGLFGYYRSFIHRYSIIAAPLTALMRGIKPEKKADGSYTQRMGETPIQWSTACQEAFEALKQKLTNPPVLAYPDFMNPFILYVDASHAGMACALHQSTPTRPPKHAARKGADETTARPMEATTKADLSELQQRDPTWKKIFDNIHLFPQFTIKDGLLYHEECLCMPHNKSFITSILHDAHDVGGHMGVSKSYDRLRRQWYRPGMFNILRSYVKSCVTCKGVKLSKQKPTGDMHPQRNMSAMAFDNIAIDVFSLPMTKGFDACLAIADTFTKAVVLRPTRTTASTEDIAELLFANILCKGFLPSTIISDKDPKYTSELWSAVMKKLGTQIELTSPYHQQADPAERTIQTVQNILRCYKDVDWVSRLPYVELAINDTKNESTGFRPNDLLYVARRGPTIDAMVELDNEEFPELLAQAKQKVREALDNIRIAQGRQKVKHDSKHQKPEKIEVGDFAFLLLDKHEVKGIKRNKLSWPKWGPFRVLAVTDTTVDLEFPSTSKKDPTVSRQHIERVPPDEFDRALPEPELIDGEQAWEVEAIIGERIHGKAKEQQFRIKWKGWAINHASWEPEDTLRADMDPETLDRMITEYRESKKGATSRARKRLQETGSSAKAMQAVEAEAKAKVGGETQRIAGNPAETTMRERPILYLSRTLRSYERNYTILELELGAVVWSVLKLQRYLDGVPFTVVTDHQPILQVVASNSKTITSPRVERWRMLLQPYMGQMTFIHKAGKIHSNVDALSRLSREEVTGTKVGGSEDKRRAGEDGVMGQGGSMAGREEGLRRRRKGIGGDANLSEKGHVTGRKVRMEDMH
jgi:hypothetical protein